MASSPISIARSDSFRPSPNSAFSSAPSSFQCFSPIEQMVASAKAPPPPLVAIKPVHHSSESLYHALAIRQQFLTGFLRQKAEQVIRQLDAKQPVEEFLDHMRSMTSDSHDESLAQMLHDEDDEQYFQTRVTIAHQFYSASTRLHQHRELNWRGCPILLEKPIANLSFLNYSLMPKQLIVESENLSVEEADLEVITFCPAYLKLHFINSALTFVRLLDQFRATNHLNWTRKLGCEIVQILNESTALQDGCFLTNSRGLKPVDKLTQLQLGQLRHMFEISLNPAFLGTSIQLQSKPVEICADTAIFFDPHPDCVKINPRTGNLTYIPHHLLDDKLNEIDDLEERARKYAQRSLKAWGKIDPSYKQLIKV